MKCDNSAITAARISCCYQEIGDYEKALEYNEYATAIDSTDNENRLSRADILYEMGNCNEAISQIDDYINNDPESFWGYYKRVF